MRGVSHVWHCWMTSLKTSSNSSLKLLPSSHLRIWRRQGWKYIKCNNYVFMWSHVPPILHPPSSSLSKYNFFRGDLSKTIMKHYPCNDSNAIHLVTQGEESKRSDGEAPLGQMEKRSNKGALPCLISWAINNNFAFFRSQISSSDPQGRKQWLHIQI